MSSIYTMALKAEDYPNGARVYALKRGDCMWFKGDHNVKLGEKYKDHPAIVSRIDYKPKKWWQFWKKKEVIGYQVMWIGDEDDPSDDVNPRKAFENFMSSMQENK